MPPSPAYKTAPCAAWKAAASDEEGPGPWASKRAVIWLARLR